MEEKKKKRTTPIEVRLTSDDQDRFDRICRLEGKKRPEIARRAIVFYLDALERQEEEVRESALERRLKRMEDRLAALLARGNIDVGVIIQLIYRNMNPETRADVLKTAHKMSALRIRQKIEEAKDIQDLYRKEIAKVVLESEEAETAQDAQE
jgi:hypothetical protein